MRRLGQNEDVGWGGAPGVVTNNAKTFGLQNLQTAIVGNYRYLLCDNPEMCSSHTLHGRSLKSCNEDS